VMLGTSLLIPMPEGYFGRPGAQEVGAGSFRDAFISNFVRIVATWTWWLGALAGGLILYRRNGWQDGIWGLVCGAVLGLVGRATSVRHINAALRWTLRPACS